MAFDNGTSGKRPSLGAPPPNDGSTARPSPPGVPAPPGRSGRSPFWRTWRFWLTVAIVAAINWFLAPVILPENRDRLTTSYTFFTAQVAAGNISEITSRGNVIQ